MAWWWIVLLTLFVYQLAWLVALAVLDNKPWFTPEDAIPGMLGLAYFPLFILATPFRRRLRYMERHAYYTERGISWWQYFWSPSKARRKADAWLDPSEK